jgi:hypothetical protein
VHEIDEKCRYTVYTSVKFWRECDTIMSADYSFSSLRKLRLFILSHFLLSESKEKWDFSQCSLVPFHVTLTDKFARPFWHCETSPGPAAEKLTGNKAPSTCDVDRFNIRTKFMPLFFRSLSMFYLLVIINSFTDLTLWPDSIQNYFSDWRLARRKASTNRRAQHRKAVQTSMS